MANVPDNAKKNVISEIVGEMNYNFCRFMTKLGAHIVYLAVTVLSGIKKFFSRIFGKVINKIGEKSQMRTYFLKRKKEFIEEKDKVSEFFFWLEEDTESAFVNEGFFKATKVAVIHILKGLWHARGYAVRAFNWILPIVSVAFMLSVLNQVADLSYGVGVEYKGQNLGILGTESEYDETEKSLQERITYVEGDEKVTITPKLAVKLITDETDTVTPDELVDKLLINSDADIVEACGVYVDGEFLGAVKDRQTVDSMLSRRLSRYIDEDVKDVFFDKEVELSDGLFLTNSIVESKEIIDTFGSSNATAVYYTAEKGDTPSGIAQKYDLTTAELAAMNPGILTSLRPGDEITVSVEEPYLSVNVVKQETYNEAIPYETIRTETDSLYKGDSRTVVKGVQGERRVVADVVYHNGIEVSRNILESAVLSEPKAAQVQVGTKPLAPITGIKITGTGIYSWPVAGGYISSYMGDGRGHKGIDIAAPYGTTIFAAEEGVVTKVQKIKYGYGYNFYIQHNDGTLTHYAHCSAIYVSVGQKVIKGEPVAAVGSTGQSTGNHLHFEVIKNGVFKNPMDYIK
ncbi:MAG: peptidoglycan DD-metalloendopeptidase family protein [Oscillospiraceae bacterium]